MAVHNVKMSDPLPEETRKVARDVDEFIASLQRKEYKDGWPEDKWEEEMEKHPLFTKNLDVGQEMSPLLEALQALKYSPECNTPNELAEAYKVDGNEHFKKGLYQDAEIAYTEGLKCECEDKNLNSILYCNRAAARYNIGRYTQALEDTSKCIELDPNNVKAYYRSAQCYFGLEKYEDCVAWCEDGLKRKKKDKALLDLKKKALMKIETELVKKQELEKQKQALETLNNAIRERGINLVEGGITQDSLQYEYIGTVAKVHMTDKGVLMWPVVLFYPQHNTTDFIPAFNEDFCLFEYFMDLFMEHAAWDVRLEYTPENLKVYFADSEGNIIPVNEMQSLKSIMQNKRFKVTTGHLSFFVTSLQYDQIYRNQNNVVDF